jgi:hypothetical protein
LFKYNGAEIGDKIKKVFSRNTVFIGSFFILFQKRIHPTYKMTFFKKFRLGYRMYRNTRKVQTETNYKAHLVMAVKILGTPPDILGDVVECGTFKGGSAINLSIACKITGRKLRIYDSFEGLPEPHPDDREATPMSKGLYRCSMEDVKSNIRRYGEIDCCEFIKGWYDDTLPGIKGPILLAFLDVDFEASLDICVRSIWPQLIDTGYIFIDEYLSVSYCSLFFSEKYWKKYFNRTPPGLIGSGCGLPLGDYFIGPWDHMGFGPYGLESSYTIAYTRKDMNGHWTFYPDEKK